MSDLKKKKVPSSSKVSFEPTTVRIEKTGPLKFLWAGRMCGSRALLNWNLIKQWTTDKSTRTIIKKLVYRKVQGVQFFFIQLAAFMAAHESIMQEI